MFENPLHRWIAVVVVLAAATLFVAFRTHIPTGVMVLLFPVLLFAALLTVVYVLARVSLKIW